MIEFHWSLSVYNILQEISEIPRSLGLLSDHNIMLVDGNILLLGQTI